MSRSARSVCNAHVENAFHDATLLYGAMPLTVLEGVVDRYVATARQA